MPKRTNDQNDRVPDNRGKAKPAVQPRCRPCPRCYVPLELEREYKSRGLSGVESTHQTYICPACDARFKLNPADGNWRELY